MWTKEEINLLESNAGLLSAKELCVLLNKTKNSIKIKARRMKISLRVPTKTVETVCIFCEKSFKSLFREGRKFCSQSCSASYNNKNYFNMSSENKALRLSKIKCCEKCGQQTKNKRYCSRVCSGKVRVKIAKIEEGVQVDVDLLIEEVYSNKKLTRESFLEHYGDKLSVDQKDVILKDLFPLKLNVTMAKYHSDRRGNIKQELVDYKGGKCQICGYNRCLRSLHFHHIDPKQKDFTIAKHMKKLNKSKIFTELDKCVLLCSNCHYEVHEGLINIDQIKL